MTATMKTETNGKTRKSLADEIDRLQALVGSLDTALAHMIEQAVAEGVRQACTAVLHELISNRQLHEEMQQANRSANSCEEKSSVTQGRMSRLWSATKATLQRAVQTVRSAGRGVGVALMAAGGMIAGGLYAVRKPIAAATSYVYRHGKAAVVKVGAFLARLLPLPVYCSA